MTDQQPMQLPSSGPMPEPMREPKKRHLIRNVALGVGAFVVVVTAVGALSGGGSNGTSAASPGVSATSAAEHHASKPKKKVTPGIGEPVRDGKFEFTVTSVSHKKSVGDEFSGDTAQGEYTLVHLTVRNIGDKPQTLDDDAQKGYTASGAKYDASSNADIDLGGATFYTPINPGNSLKGTIAFDVPTGTDLASVELHDSVFSGGVKVALR